ncbi:hypothetical protein, partial [Sporisorium scitamineum]
LKVGRKADSHSVQPFRIDLNAPYDTDDGLDGGVGFFEVTADGNVAVDITLGNASRSQEREVVPHSGCRWERVDQKGGSST